jgi:hypothetical protein
MWEMIQLDEHRNLVETAERYADGLASMNDLVVANVECIEWCHEDLPCGDPDAHAAAVESVQSAWRFFDRHLQDSYHALNRAQQRAANHVRQIEGTGRQGNVDSDEAYARALRLATETSAATAQAKAKLTDDGLQDEQDTLLATQAELLRCVVGTPFRPLCVDSPLTRTVAALAQGIYDERSFDRLPVLADALEEAGCTNADILNHCRSDGPHVRGCWVVDLLLGKK